MQARPRLSRRANPDQSCLPREGCGGSLEQCFELAHCEADFPDDRPEGPFGKFCVIGNRDSTMRQLGVA
jgi:hypothetical protein